MAAGLASAFFSAVGFACFMSGDCCDSEIAVIELLTSEIVAQALNLVRHGRGNKQKTGKTNSRKKS
ncbi:MAG: hypothetical protein AAFV28_00410, partial [Cyanobacteria bacterium J06635_13]